MQTPVSLVLGASPNSERYSYLATALLHEKGYAVYPFGIKKGMIDDIAILNEWPLNNTIDTVTLYVGPAGQKEYYDAILALQPRRIIFNPGTENPEFYQLLQLNNIKVEVACTLVLLTTNQF